MKSQMQFFLDISDILEKYGIRYCVMFGTLLGFVRNGNFISWDDEDIDIGIFTQFWKDDILWRRFVLELDSMGYKINDMAYNYVSIKSKDSKCKVHVDFYLFLDLKSEYLIKVTSVEFHIPKQFLTSLDYIKIFGKQVPTPSSK